MPYTRRPGIASALSVSSTPASCSQQYSERLVRRLRELVRSDVLTGEHEVGPELAATW